ncbi:MAG: hypothetical protein AAFX50_16825, partial [Acidobacteriota bacterium]
MPQLARLIPPLAWLLLAPGLLATPMPVGGEIQVNAGTAGRQLNPVLAARPGGGAVVVWEDEQAGEDRTVFGRLVGAGGVPVGDDFQISVGTTDDRTSPSVAALPGGEFLVAWENSTDGGEFASVRTYDAAGQPGGVVVLEAADPDVSVFDPVAVAADDGHFVVIWETYDSDVNESAFRARRVDAAGAAQGSVFTLESATADDFVGSGVAAPRA